jgi:dTDP-4-amino-4,6-dideoxygalactose transaminase
MLYVAHLGKRFTASARAQIVEDLAACSIEAAAYCAPLHRQFHYERYGCRRGQLPDTERIADRALALPLHGHLDEDQVKFVVRSLKDASVNVGAGAAIYL